MVLGIYVSQLASPQMNISFFIVPAFLLKHFCLRIVFGPCLTGLDNLANEDPSNVV